MRPDGRVSLRTGNRPAVVVGDWSMSVRRFFGLSLGLALSASSAP
jgi:hypothetical protein